MAVWTRAQTLALIQIWGDENIHSSYQNQTGYEKISTRLEDGGLEVSVTMDPVPKQSQIIEKGLPCCCKEAEIVGKWTVQVQVVDRHHFGRPTYWWLCTHCFHSNHPNLDWNRTVSERRICFKCRIAKCSVNRHHVMIMCWIEPRLHDHHVTAPFVFLLSSISLCCSPCIPQNQCYLQWSLFTRDFQVFHRVLSG